MWCLSTFFEIVDASFCANWFSSKRKTYLISFKYLIGLPFFFPNRFLMWHSFRFFRWFHNLLCHTHALNPYYRYRTDFFSHIKEYLFLIVCDLVFSHSISIERKKQRSHTKFGRRWRARARKPKKKKKSFLIHKKKEIFKRADKRQLDCGSKLKKGYRCQQEEKD